MHKLLLSLLLGSSLSFAGIINGIALTVNEAPITMYDISKTMTEKNINKNQAVSILIDQILYDQLVDQHNITADIFDVNNHIEKLAAQNGMDVYSFKSIIRQKYSDYSVFENETKQVVIRQKLMQKIVRGNLKIATDEDMKLYYENNQEKFTTAEKIEVMQYVSKNKASLIKTVKSPLITSSDVQKRPMVLETNKLSPQMQYLLNSSKVNTFTPIFTANKMFNTLFVMKKEGKTTLDFESVKRKIFSDIMSQREKKYLKNYFEKQKLTADIKIVR